MINIFNTIIAFFKGIFSKPVAIFDPFLSGYLPTFSENFKSGIDWGKWTWVYPGDQDQKEKTVWDMECVQPRSDGLALIATRGNKVNVCGQICSHRFLNILYGYISVTTKMPPKGFLYFPAIWMFNKNGWQPEIDIVELMGFDSKAATFTHHWLGADGNDKSEGKGVNLPIDLSQGFHNYSVEWTPDRLTWYLDGKKQYETTSNIPQVPLFLVCGIQAGPAGKGQPAFTHLYTASEVPAEMVVKKIEIFQKQY